MELQRAGRSRESLEMFRRAVEAYRAIADPVGEGRCLNGVGALHKDLGEMTEAAVHLERALVLRRRTRDHRGEAVTLTTLGPVYQRLSHPERGLASALSMLCASLRAIGDRGGEGQVLYNLADLAQAEGQLSRAHTWLRRPWR